MTDETDGKVTIELVGDVSRREFFSATAKFGVTTALVAAAASTLTKHADTSCGPRLGVYDTNLVVDEPHFPQPGKGPVQGLAECRIECIDRAIPPLVGQHRQTH